MAMREFNEVTGTTIEVMPDKSHPGTWISGISPGRGYPMEFKGGFDSYNDALADARIRLKKARKDVSKKKKRRVL